MALNLGSNPFSIAVVGAAGGVGHYAVQVAKDFGYQVVGVSTGQEKVEFTKK